MKQESYQNQGLQNQLNLDTLSTWITQNTPLKNVSAFSQLFQNIQNVTQEPAQPKTKQQIFNACQARVEKNNKILKSFKDNSTVKKLDLMDSQLSQNSKKAFEQLIQYMSSIKLDEIKNNALIPRRKRHVDTQSDEMILFIQAQRGQPRGRSARQSSFNPQQIPVKIPVTEFQMMNIVNQHSYNQQNPLQQQKQIDILGQYLNPIPQIDQGLELQQQPTDNKLPELKPQEQMKMEQQTLINPQNLSPEYFTTQLQVGEIYLQPLDAEIQIRQQMKIHQTQVNQSQLKSFNIMEQQ